MMIFASDSLSDKTFLITGASSGIGRTSAKLLTDCGAKVIVAGRNSERLDLTLAELSGSGHLSSVVDFANADQSFDWINGLIKDVGALDGVFHCAGTELIRPIKMTKQAQLDELFGSSLFSAFGIARGLSQKNALKNGGSVVFMSSVASINGQSGMTAYSSTKAGIDGLVRSLACEMAPRQIRVNSIVAGAIKTPMHERLTQASSDDAISKYEQMHLLGFGDAYDVAQCATYLLGPASRWITGTSIVIDGGYAVR
jgi:NAD(P)-dependent dehydrogenase (short-subunit alcohol dehydrogenase family)